MMAQPARFSPGGPDKVNDAQTLYELWQFIPKNNEDGGKSWAAPKRKFISSDQGTLENLVKSVAQKEPVEEQYRSLNKRRKGLVDELVVEHAQRDARFEWTCVYIKVERRKVRTLFGFQDINVKMDVILMRKLQLPVKSPTAPPAFSNNELSPAKVQNLGASGSQVMGGNPALEGLARKATNPQITGNVNPIHVNPVHGSPGPSKEKGHANLPGNSGMPSTQPPLYIPAGHPLIHAKGQHPQSNPQGNPAVGQHAMSGLKLPVPEASRNYAIGQGAGAGPLVSKLDHETRTPARKAPLPTSMNKNSQGKQVQGMVATHPRHNMAAALSPSRRVIPPERQQLHKGRACTPEDSDSMSGYESLFEDAGYSSASSTDSDANERPLGQATSQGPKFRSVDALPSASALRMRDNRRMQNRSGPIHPSTMPGGGHNFQMAGPSAFGLSWNETAFRLLKVQEQQRHIMDRLQRLELQQSQKGRGNEVGPEMAMLGRRVLYQEAGPPSLYRRRVNYAGQEAMPYVYETYY